MNKAIQLYRDAASAGDADAMAGLGNLYLRADGVPLDPIEGTKMLEKSAALGNEWGEVFLAHALIRSATNEADQKRGLQLLKASVAQKNPEALFELGNLSEEGKLVSRDSKTAIKYYMQAARQDFAPAERELAAVFASGLGVSQDDLAAYFWATLAAAHGDSKSLQQAELIKPKLTQAELAEVQRMDHQVSKRFVR
jgi:TPR repeat protein